MVIYINKEYSTLLLTKRNHYTVVIYNAFNYISIALDKEASCINPHQNLIEWRQELFLKKWSSLASNILNNYTFLWNYLLFKKVNYRGKSFKFKKKRNFVNFILNTSHISWTISRLHLLKRIRKTKLLYFYSNEHLFSKFIHQLISYRYINLYTKRGLRLSRSKIFKKKGKTNMKV